MQTKMNKATVANAIFKMAREIETSSPTKRAFVTFLDENGDKDQKEVPLGTNGAETWVSVYARWQFGEGKEVIEWEIHNKDYNFAICRSNAVAAARKIAAMVLRGKTFADAKRSVLAQGARYLWEGDLPGGWSDLGWKATPWWLV